jgi:tetratricopeptide (TPR) repeat protein
VLVSKGLYSGYDGDLEGALLFLQRGLDRLDPDNDSQLRFLALHNIALCRIEQGRFREARTALFQMLPLYHQHAGRMDWVRRRWLEGRIAAGLGELDKAERAFRAARADFEAAGLVFAAAITDLDLVAVWLRQGRTKEIYRAVGGLVDTFREIGVEREALGAVLLLAEALTRDGMTLDLVEATAHVLRRLERTQPMASRAWR